ncbi:MAG: hypothetical protein WBE74_16540 [Terracidiphilus sp.]
MRVSPKAGLLLYVVAALSFILSMPPLARPQSAPAAGQTSAPDPPAKPDLKPELKAELKAAPPTPIALQKAALGDPDPWNPDWDKAVETALPADLLSPDLEHQVKPLCPRFRYLSDADRRAFWAYFFQALAGAEAGLKPTTNVRHREPEVAVIDTVTHRTVRQEGLLQLTYMDADRYGCDFDWAHDKELPEHDPAKTILQPENNLLCGVKILENQLITRHEDLFSRKSYWVTLRPRHPSFIVFIRQMANVPEYCGSRYHTAVPSTHSLPPASEASNTPAKGPATSASAQPASGSRTAAGLNMTATQSSLAAH